MKTDVWLDAMSVGVTDGHYYELADDEGAQGFVLNAWSDDGSMTDDELNKLTLHDQVRLGGFCEVSDSAFDSYDEQWTFAKEIAPLFDTTPLTIIRSIKG